jgi:tetratricopeptide (TPR) repeat protein
LLWLTGLFLLSSQLNAQLARQQAASSVKPDPLEQHYQVARTFSIAGDTERATSEYQAFLAEALRQLANVDSKEAKMPEATAYFDEAISLEPKSAQLRIDYGNALFAHEDLNGAKEQAQKAAELAPGNSDAQYLFGRVLYQEEKYDRAKEHLEAAAKLLNGQLTFALGYDLARTYLKLQDVNRASVMFDEMMLGYGDTARLRLYFGYAYLMSGVYERAISEFKKALEKDPKIKEGHYLLGLAYLSRDEDKGGWDENAAEDRLEIQVNPDDFAPHYDLGNIALHLHRTDEAERELKRASEIQPDNPDPQLALGELFINQRRLPEAEAAMSKAIALSKDVSRNGYQVNRAYYVLGRIQVETGRRELGVPNLKTAAELREKTVASPSNRNESAATAQQRIAVAQPARPDAEASTIPPEEQKQLAAYFDHLKPAIADAYNNLGVAAGAKNDFAAAIADFRKAQQWDPELETLERNLGMSQFHAGNYPEAILPLWRALQSNPDDERVRVALGLSYFSVQNYEGAANSLQPIEKTVASDPGAGVAYSVALVKTGNYERGMTILRSLEQANPKLAGIHGAMGETYADQGIYAKAIEEFKEALALDPSQPRTHFLLGVALLRQGSPADAMPEFRSALASNPSDVATRYHLAVALLQTEQRDEARNLLQQVIRQDPRYADAYYQLGKLQLDGGEAKQAIANLESAASLSPRSDYIHYELSLAYGRDSRDDDARREMQLYQALKTERRGDHEQPRSN